MPVRNGHVRVGAILGVPIFLHWSLPIGLFVFSGFEFVPEIFFGIFAIILVHELGHAAMAKLRGCPVQAIEMSGIGGVCRAQSRTELDVIAIAWGGVLAQLWLYLVVTGYFLVLPVETPSQIIFHSVMTRTNLMIVGLNLIPIEPLDGAQAWRIVPALGWFRREDKAPPLTAADDPRAAKRAAPAVATATEDEIAQTVKEALARAREESRPSRDSVK